MALISVNDLSVSFTDPPLLDNISLQLEEGERVGLLGRNGAGKTTLMKLLAGGMTPNQGAISRKPDLRIAYLPQEAPPNLQGRVFDLVYSGFQEIHSKPDPAIMEEEWRRRQQAEQVISQFKLDPDGDASTLSAGWKRRVLLAKGLVCKPHVLLLDEPTNHLDIESIEWLEKFLLRFAGTLLFVTHDRLFLQKIADRIIEIDRGALLSWNCDYQTYLQRKEEALEIEESQRMKFDKKLAQEEEWLRRSPKARRTRNEGRVRALLKRREEQRKRRSDPGRVRLLVQQAERSGDLVIDAQNLCFSFDRNEIVKDFSVTIMRGDKVGVIGPNGVGKTTLLKILLNELEPNSGRVKHGTKLEIAYFDQLREQLNEDESIIQNVGGGSDHVAVNGQSRHIVGYLKDFLFSPERARSPIKILSGGERSRVLMAKLFTQPANVLVFDEPTNDLDAETLELLENLLVEYSGTILLVSHDRAFLNNVATSTLAMEGDGRVNEYVGGYDDWLRQRKEDAREIKEERIRKRRQSVAGADQPKRLSYNEKRQLQQKHEELQNLPDKIEDLENEQRNLHEKMMAPDFFKQNPDRIVEAQDRLAQIEDELKNAYQRWDDLDSLFQDLDLKQIL
ncbi:MAG: ATP-binding cassette domain-containing protein [Candidatus Omnitrophica bacterium]|nr:ATP-binding cassette domain-containing protein [Candidatus Omnitrophota bacterium]